MQLNSVTANKHADERERRGGNDRSPVRIPNIDPARQGPLDRFESRIQTTKGSHGAIAPGEMRALLILGGDVTLKHGNREMARLGQGQILPVEADLGELALTAHSGPAHWALATINRR